jgi:Fic family protein
MNNRNSTITNFRDTDELIHDEDEIALLEAKNGLLQFDEVLRLAEEFSSAQQFTATPDLILELNRIAIQGIRRSAGQFRQLPVEISNTPHLPPKHEAVPQLVSEMCDYVNGNWRKHNDNADDAIHISAYLMWRVNWIHPFRDGNGRTSRAMSYLALCTRLGRLVPGTPTIADQIVDNRMPYYAALDAADAAWKAGLVDVSEMEILIRELLVKQLASVSL